MRRLPVALLTLTLCSAVAVAARAQDSVRVRSRGPDRTFTYSIGPDDYRLAMRRGRLGVTVDLRADAARDSIGARVSGVTPGGPADRAGVQAGDIILRLNGTRLAVDAAAEGDDERSRPGMRLINLTSRIEAGDTVRLDLRRDGRPVAVTFTAAETEMDHIVERMRIPGGQMFMGEFGPARGPMRMALTSVNALGDLELIRVGAELAQALGLSEGVLVAEAGSDTSLGLRTGDVITSIGGRRATSPAQAMRILSSYESGEAVQFDVMRQRRRMSVSGRLPAARQFDWQVRPNSFEFTAPRMPAEIMEMFERSPELEHLLPRLNEMQQQQRRHELHEMPRLRMRPDVEIRHPSPEPKMMIRLEGQV